jgi:uncharacterized protein YegL
MNNELTDITFILDKSGSMSNIVTDTIGGVNTFVQTQKEAPGKASLSMIQFDHEYTPVYSCVDVHSVENLTNKTYIPRGNTALLDAIGRTIVTTGNRLAAMDEKDRPSKVLMVIITDGFENASREFSKESISKMIKLQEETYNWDFVYLGANQDAIATGSSMNFAANNSYDFAATPKGVRDAYDTLAEKTCMYRSGDISKGDFFSAEDRAKQDL